MEDATETRLWQTITARNVTAILLAAQLVGCTVDMVEPQATLLAVFCMATVPESPLLEWAGLLVWLTLALSWIVGLASLKFAPVRPIYWMLLACIPVAFVAQLQLLRHEVFYCDAP